MRINDLKETNTSPLHAPNDYGITAQLVSSSPSTPLFEFRQIEVPVPPTTTPLIIEDCMARTVAVDIKMIIKNTGE